MSDLRRDHTPRAAETRTVAFDAGLRRYMLGVYNKVALGLAVAAGVAYATASVPWLRDLMFTTGDQPDGVSRTWLSLVGSLVAVAPLLLLRAASGGVLSNPTPSRTRPLYWSVVALVGAYLGVVLL